MNSIKNGEEVLVKATVINCFSGLRLIIVGENLPISIGEDCIASCSLKTYEDGLNDAWEAVRKISLNVAEGGLPTDDLIKIFDGDNPYRIIKKYTGKECVEKIKAWEEKNKFHVGEIVNIEGARKAVVSRVEDNCCYILDETGCVAKYFDTSSISKTGRTIDIESLLKQIGGAI